MNFYSFNGISNEEKQSILSKHKEIYNGYQTLVPNQPNTQPLYTQDFRLDQQGMTLNNKGNIKPFTNHNIQEGVMDQCEQCGGQMNEGECSECGYRMEETKEGLGDLLKKRAKKFKETVYGKEKDLKRPYTAEAVEKIIKLIKSAKTEEHLRSAMKMFENLTDSNEDVKDVYKERIMKAYRRKADDLDFYLKKSDLKSLSMNEYKTGKLSDIENVSDFNPDAEFDYVGGARNKDNTFEKMHHMKSLKAESATSNTPLSYGKNYDEIWDAYEFKTNGPVGDGGTLRQKNVKEQTVGGGNAPDFDMEVDKPAFDFKSKGPKEDTYTIKAPDMDLDDEDVVEPYDFISGGADNGGDAYPVNEMEYETMTSAFEDEMEEQDVSGVQGIYGDMEPAYNFHSSGAGPAGPYQTFSVPQGYKETNESETDEQYPLKHKYKKMLRKKDVEKRGEEFDSSEFDITDYEDFNPEGSSWEEITATTGEDEFSNLGEDVKEKLQIQKDKINEMFLRMRNFN